MNLHVPPPAGERNDSSSIPLDLADQLNAVRDLVKGLHFAICGFSSASCESIQPLSVLATEVENRLDKLTLELGTRDAPQETRGAA